MECNFNYSELKTYSGYYIDKNKLKESASGGAATVISENIIKSGGCVFGIVYTNNFYEAEYYCAETLEELKKLKGSKYVETKKTITNDGKLCSVYDILENKLKLGKKVLYIGLGCDIGAVYKICENKNLDISNLYTIELICHGPTTKEVHSKYISELEEKFNSKIIDFTVKYKKVGWVPQYIHAEFENRKIYERPFAGSDYGVAFSIYTRKACFNCKFRADNHKADIVIGDYWGLQKDMPGYNEYGVSIMFVRNEKGDSLIKDIDDTIFSLQETSTKFALENNKMYYKCREKHQKYDAFEKNFKCKGLHYAVTYRDGFIKAVIRKIKNKLGR